MFKEILNLDGVKVLSKNEMKTVDGGNRNLNSLSPSSCESSCSADSDCSGRGSVCKTYECTKTTEFRSCWSPYTY
jgi:bacteriocin-like protein